MWKRIEEEMRIRVENETKAKLEVEAAYKLFDLSPNASVDEITKRYKELAWEFHPDKRKSDNNID
jgi:DnaJ-class molecular chaperone